MNKLLRSSIATNTLGVLPPRAQRAVKHGKRALWSAPPSVFITLANLATFIHE